METTFIDKKLLLQWNLELVLTHKLFQLSCTPHKCVNKAIINQELFYKMPTYTLFFMFKNIILLIYKKGNNKKLPIT